MRSKVHNRTCDVTWQMKTLSGSQILNFSQVRFMISVQLVLKMRSQTSPMSWFFRRLVFTCNVISFIPNFYLFEILFDITIIVQQLAISPANLGNSFITLNFCWEWNIYYILLLLPLKEKTVGNVTMYFLHWHFKTLKNGGISLRNVGFE